KCRELNKRYTLARRQFRWWVPFIEQNDVDRMDAETRQRIRKAWIGWARLHRLRERIPVFSRGPRVHEGEIEFERAMRRAYENATGKRSRWSREFHRLYEAVEADTREIIRKIDGRDRRLARSLDLRPTRRLRPY